MSRRTVKHALGLDTSVASVGFSAYCCDRIQLGEQLKRRSLNAENSGRLEQHRQHRLRPQDRVLEVEFRQSGEIYRYFDVPDEEHAAFLAAESKGTHLNQVFKARGYRYMRIS